MHKLLWARQIHWQQCCKSCVILLTVIYTAQHTQTMHCCVSTATLVMQKCHNVQLYVHCLSCLVWDDRQCPKYQSQVWFYAQGWPNTCGHPSQVNNLAPLKMILCEIFRYITGLANFLGCVHKWHILFKEILSCTETSVYWHVISDYSCDIVAPVIGWCTGQLPGWASP